MNPHERAFVEAFIPSPRREKFLSALANPQKRPIFNRELHHPKPSFLLPKYIQRTVQGQQHTRFLGPKLRGMGATDDCWVFGNQIDGQAMTIEGALRALVGYGTGTIVSCVPGKLAFLETEDERLILYKP
jgi:hypothetical protein